MFGSSSHSAGGLRRSSISYPNHYYENPASGFPRYRKLRKGTSHEKNVCLSLVNKVNQSVTLAEKLKAELKQRRERLVDGGTASGLKKNCNEEHSYLTGSMTTLQEHLDKLLTIHSELNLSYLSLSKSRVKPETTVNENARIKRRKKENVRKSKKQARKRFLLRCQELLNSLTAEEGKATDLFVLVKDGKKVPREQKLIDESQLRAQGLYTLKTRFHLKALEYLKKLEVFDGEALEHINCAVNQLSGDSSAVNENDSDYGNDCDDDDHEEDQKDEDSDNKDDDNDKDNDINE